MNNKDFNNLIQNVGESVKPLQQIIYEILIIISIYYFFETLRNSQKTISKNHKSFIILAVIFAVLIDWFIWNNYIQTSLFIFILAVYIFYNFQNVNIISHFINLSKELNSYSPIIPKPINDKPTTLTIQEISLPYAGNINNKSIPVPFDINDTNSIKAINEVYKNDKPYETRITDTKYAEIMLNQLYNTPQYHNIIPNEIDESLTNNIHYPSTTQPQITIPTTTETTQPLEITHSQSIRNNENSNEDLKKSFQHPMREFLDESWLFTRTYNDNCISNKRYNQEKNNNEVVKFGKVLEKCTNQEDTVSKEQLENISNNNLEPIYNF